MQTALHRTSLRVGPGVRSLCIVLVLAMIAIGATARWPIPPVHRDDLPAALPLGKSAFGTLVFQTPHSTTAAVVLYVRQPGAKSDVDNALNTIYPNQSNTPSGPTCTAAPQTCSTPESGPHGLDAYWDHVDGPLRNFSSTLNVKGEPLHGTVSLDPSTYLVITFVKTDATPMAPPGGHLGTVPGELQAVKTSLDSGIRNLDNFSVVASWNPSFWEHASLERPQRTSVLGPLSWSADSKVASVPAEPVTTNAFALHSGSIFLPTSALAFTAIGFASSFAINPLARWRGLDPWLPAPFLCAIWGLLGLFLTNEGIHLALPAWAWFPLFFALFFAAVLATYVKTRRMGFLHRPAIIWAVAAAVVTAIFLWREITRLDIADPIGGLRVFYDGKGLHDKLAYVITQALVLFVGFLLLGVALVILYEVASRAEARAYVKGKQGEWGSEPDDAEEAVVSAITLEIQKHGKPRTLSRGATAVLLRRHARPLATGKASRMLAAASITRSPPDPQETSLDLFRRMAQ